MLMKTIKILALLPLFCLLAMSCDDKDDDLRIDLSQVKPADSFVDQRDGKTYECVRIGDQIWMAENLAYYCIGGTYDGCYTWDQRTMSVSSIELEKDVFCDLWTKTVNDPAYDWSVISRYPAEHYMNLLKEYMSDITTQAELIATINHIFYRPFRDAFYDKKDKYIREHLEDFYHIFYSAMKDAEKVNGNYSETYGFLYSLEGARKAVPEGWRLPSDEDWKKLEKTLGMPDNELNAFEAWRGAGIGAALKIGGGTGFYALMGGGNHYQGGGANLYINLDESAYFWSNECRNVEIANPNAPEEDDKNDDSEGSDEPTMIQVREGVIRQVSLYSNQIWRGSIRIDVNNRAITCSVRCVKDVK